MKRYLIWLLPVLLLLTTACSGSLWDKNDPYLQPVVFYYAAGAEASYDTQTGALFRETRDLGSREYSLSGFVELYLDGPEDPMAELPFPAQMELLDIRNEAGTLYLYVSDQWSEMSVLEEHLAEACLVLTMTQFSEVEQVCIRTELDVESQIPDLYLKRDDFLIYDDSATNDQVTVKLYFSDSNGRFLVEESRSRSAEALGSMPEYILQQLLKGPENNSSLPVLPEGTNLLGVELTQGICTVNFSEAFLTNRPKSHTQARMAVFSVVNSLTELSQVESVSFLCVGEEIGDYAGLDLSRPLQREELALDNNRSSAAVLDTILYLPCGDDKLAAVPMYVRQSSGKMGADAVLSALLSFKPANGYENPFPDGTAVVDQITRNGLCTVTFNSAFALRNADPDDMQLAIRSVVATLCELEQIDYVQVEVYNTNSEEEGLNQPLTPQPNWFLP